MMRYQLIRVEKMEELEMTDRMKVGLVFGLITIVFMIQIITRTTTEVEANPTEAENLRLRVIAHSDDEKDQLIKRLAVFAVTDFMNRHELGYTTEFLANHLEDIHEIVVELLTEINVATEVEVSIGHHYFPTSETHHASLIIRLGEARGENWWCFINPGVCIVPTDDNTSVNTAQVEVRTEIQESISTRTLNFIGGLFGGSERSEVAEGEIDWFLFDDER